MRINLTNNIKHKIIALSLAGASLFTLSGCSVNLRISKSDPDEISENLDNNDNNPCLLDLIECLNEYDNYSYDQKEDVLYLYDETENSTKILSLKTKEITTIEGHVMAAHNNFIVLNSGNSYGVYKFTGFDKELAEIIPSEFESIGIIAYDEEEKPIFGCYTNNDIRKQIASIYLSTGQKLPNDYCMVGKTNKENYMTGIIVEEGKLFSDVGQEVLINTNGEEIFTTPKGVFIDEIYPEHGIILTSKTIGKHGIINFDNEVIQEPIYDYLSLYICNTGEPFYIGRIEETQDTIILNMDLKILDNGNYSIEEAENIADDISLNGSPTKTTTNNKHLILKPVV